MKLVIRDIEITPMLIRDRFLAPTWRCEFTKCVHIKTYRRAQRECVNSRDKSLARMTNDDHSLWDDYGVLLCCDQYRADEF